MLRRGFLRLAAAALAPAATRPATAQAYPARPVHLVVGFAAGGAADIVARIIAQSMSERLGQPVVVENKPGATTNIATQAVINAPPDGYTLLYITAANATNATLYDRLPFNFLRDITPVGRAHRIHARAARQCRAPGALGGRVHSLCEGQSRQAQHGLVRDWHHQPSLRRIAQAEHRDRYRPRALSWRRPDDRRPHQRPGPGRVRRSAGIAPAHPHRRAAAACGDGGDALGIAAGHPDHRRHDSGLRGDRLGRHRRARGGRRPRSSAGSTARSARALATPAVRTRLADLGSTPMPLGPAAFGAFLAAETEKWAKVVKFAGVKAE